MGRRALFGQSSRVDEFLDRIVAYERGGRHLLGRVQNVVHAGTSRERLDVHFFNGQPWPFSPKFSDVEFVDPFTSRSDNATEMIRFQKGDRVIVQRRRGPVEGVVVRQKKDGTVTVQYYDASEEAEQQLDSYPQFVSKL